MLALPTLELEPCLGLIEQLRRMEAYRVLGRTAQWQQRETLWEGGMMAEAMMNEMGCLNAIVVDWGWRDGLPRGGERSFLMAIGMAGSNTTWTVETNGPTAACPSPLQAILARGRDALRDALSRHDDHVSAVFRRGNIPAYVEKHMARSAQAQIACALMEMATAESGGRRTEQRL